MEDWIIDKSKGNGVTGWVGGCLAYQQHVIEGLEALVKYVQSFVPMLTFSFGSNYDAGRRIVGKVRVGVLGECKKEFETGIFTILETSIKLAKGTVQSPARDVQIEQAYSIQYDSNERMFGYFYVLVTLWN